MDQIKKQILHHLYKVPTLNGCRGYRFYEYKILLLCLQPSDFLQCGVRLKHISKPKSDSKNESNLLFL